jgi:hypothetical protein
MGEKKTEDKQENPAQDDQVRNTDKRPPKLPKRGNTFGASGVEKRG